MIHLTAEYDLLRRVALLSALGARVCNNGSARGDRGAGSVTACSDLLVAITALLPAHIAEEVILEAVDIRETALVSAVAAPHALLVVQLSAVSLTLCGVATTTALRAGARTAANWECGGTGARLGSPLNRGNLARG